jgi:hypothetical protein
MDEDFQPPVELRSGELRDDEIDRLIANFITPDGTDSDLSPERIRRRSVRFVNKLRVVRFGSSVIRALKRPC